jgi:hypothetical protein
MPLGMLNLSEPLLSWGALAFNDLFGNGRACLQIEAWIHLCEGRRQREVAPCGVESQLQGCLSYVEDRLDS